MEKVAHTTPPLLLFHVVIVLPDAFCLRRCTVPNCRHLHMNVMCLVNISPFSQSGDDNPIVYSTPNSEWDILASYEAGSITVSYTHLTLPTILLV